MRQFSFVKGSIWVRGRFPSPRPKRDPAGSSPASGRCWRGLPDVAAKYTTRGRSPKILAIINAHDYRFDPPQLRSLHHPHDGHHPPRVIRRESPILAHTDLFANQQEKWKSSGRSFALCSSDRTKTAAGVILLASSNDQQPSVREKVSAENDRPRNSRWNQPQWSLKPGRRHPPRGQHWYGLRAKRKPRKPRM